MSSHECSGFDIVVNEKKLWQLAISNSNLGIIFKFIYGINFTFLFPTNFPIPFPLAFQAPYNIGIFHKNKKQFVNHRTENEFDERVFPISFSCADHPIHRSRIGGYSVMIPEPISSSFRYQAAN